MRLTATADLIKQVSRAFALFPFMVATKLYLLLWFIWTAGRDPLSSVSPAAVLLFPGIDLALCGALAVAYTALHAGASLLFGRSGRILAFAATLVAHISTVLFTVASMKINKVYGVPLDVDHLRSAGDLSMMRDSLLAYMDVASVLFVVLGVAGFWVFTPVIERTLSMLLARRPAYQVFAGLAVAVVLYAGATYHQFRGVYTSGLKQNAVVLFARSYRPVREANDLEQLMKDLGSGFHETAQRLWRETSLHGEALSPHPGHGWAEGLAKDLNVVMILLESTSSVHLDTETAPNILSLYRHGLSFENFFTTSGNSYQAAYTIFYSDYPASVRLRNFYADKMPQASLFEAFSRSGYETAFFQSGYLSYGDYGHLLEDKGIDTLVGAETTLARGGNTGWTWGAFEEPTVAALADWIESNRDDKFFAVYRPVFPHHPYYTPSDSSPFSNETWQDRHRSALHYVDSNVGTLLAALDDLGLRDDTLVIVTSDHGETVSTYPVGHGLHTSNEELRVPFLLSNQRLFKQAHVSERVGNHVDLASTVTAIAGVSPGEEWMGRNLLADRVPSRLLYVMTNHARTDALIDGDLLYSFNTVSGVDELKQAGESEFSPLPPDDPRRSLMSSYRKVAGGLRKWVTWHHLSRAGHLENQS